MQDTSCWCPRAAAAGGGHLYAYIMCLFCSSVVLNLVRATEPYKFHTCKIQAAGVQDQQQQVFDYYYVGIQSISICLYIYTHIMCLCPRAAAAAAGQTELYILYFYAVDFSTFFY